jgi:hypothetical protein
MKQILYVILVLLLFSCTKEKREINKEADLSGTWRMIHMTNGEPEMYWTFSDSTTKAFSVQSDTSTNGLATESIYILTEKNYKYYIELDSINREFIDGKYLILELTDDILIIERIAWHQTTNPFLRREFIRVNTD